MRGKKAPKRQIEADPKYASTDLAKFIRYIMHDGKYATAMRVMYGALDRVSEVAKKDPLVVFDEAIKNVGPTLEVRSKRVGGANYQIPFPVRVERRFFLASKWIIDAARARKGAAMATKLSDELMGAAKGEGSAVKKRQDVNRMAEANKAFAHFAR